MTITFSHTVKRLNSTKLPTGGTEFEGTSREPFSVARPVIQVDVTGYPLFVTLFNYAYIPAFGRYYFIDEYEYDTNELLIVTLQCDVLATYRGFIIQQRNMLRRASTKWNEHIPDTLQPTTSLVTTETIRILHGYANTINGGTFVLGIVGPNVGGSFGSLQYVKVTPAQFASLCQQLYSNNTWVEDKVEELSPDLAKAVLNPMQYIVSAEWMPFNLFGAGRIVIDALGYFELPNPVSGETVSNNYASSPVWTGRMAIPLHPKMVKDETDYLNGDNWSSYTLRAAPFGEIDIPAHLLYNQTNLDMEFFLDQITGIGTLRIYSAGALGTKDVAAVSAKVSMSINLSQVINSGMANSLRDLTSVGGLGRGLNTVVGDKLLSVANKISEYSNGNNPIDRAINGVVDIATLSRRAATVSGTQGGGGFGTLFVYGAIYTLTGTFVDVPDFLPIDLFGRPLVEMGTPQALGPGYYEISDPQLEAPGTPDEIAKAARMMAAGFYYE